MDQDSYLISVGELIEICRFARDGDSAAMRNALFDTGMDGGNCDEVVARVIAD